MLVFISLYFILLVIRHLDRQYYICIKNLLIFYGNKTIKIPMKGFRLFLLRSQGATKSREPSAKSLVLQRFRSQEYADVIRCGSQHRNESD